MRTKIQKWGNSLGIRIPNVMIKELNLENDSEVEITEDSNKIIIRPVKKPLLKDLLAEIDETNIHDEIIMKSPFGKEIW